MHLSSDAKDLLYKCTILTAMMRRLTRVLFGPTFRKLTFQVNKINHKNVVKRGMSGMRGLSLVFAIPHAISVISLAHVQHNSIRTIRPI